MTQAYSDNFNDSTLSGIWTAYEDNGSYAESDGNINLQSINSGWCGIYQNNIDEYLDISVKVVSVSGTVVSGTNAYYNGYFGCYDNINDEWYVIVIQHSYINDIYTDPTLHPYGDIGGVYVDAPTMPYWLRITYGGKTFNYYYKSNIDDDWSLMYYENYESSPDIDVALLIQTFSTNVSGTVTFDDFVSTSKTVDPIPSLYGLYLYDNSGNLKYNIDDGLKYIVYVTTVSGGESGYEDITISGNRRYMALSYAVDYGTTEHQAVVTVINDSTIRLTYTQKSVGMQRGGAFRGMPSGDSIIFVLGY